MSRARGAMFLLIGWYLAMSYPRDDSITQLALSVVASTFGVILVGVTAYVLGRDAAARQPPRSSQSVRSEA